MKRGFITGTVSNNGVEVKQVSPVLRLPDYLGAVMVRWGINRDHYRIDPGLYSIGDPDESSEVFVTANYKLSFDHLRKNLDGFNCRILVLDTKGVNVWCAAGKGTFSTEELCSRIKKVSLDKIVSHRRIILPQLAATGVAAHKVKEESGFNVKFGPVRAADIREYLDSGYRATDEMRKVSFRLWDRLKLIPNDFMYGKFYLIGALAIIFLLSAFAGREFSMKNSLQYGPSRLFNVLLAYFSGIVVTPVLLPYIPFRMFSFKGFFSGLIIALLLFLAGLTGNMVMEKIAWFMIVPAVSSFMAMNFTGSSTFTSLSGVKKEMKLAVPIQVTALSAGVILFIVGLFI